MVAISYNNLSQLTKQVQTFYYFIILSFVLVVLIIIFLASIIKGIIWARITNTKITFHLVSKFLGLNLIWMTFWFILVVLVSLFIQPSAAPMFMLVLIVLAIWLTNTLYTIYMRTQKLSSIFDAIKLNISRIHMFLLPYFVIFLVFFILLRLSSFRLFLYSNIIIDLLILVYSTLVKYYASTLVMEIEKA